MYNNDNNIIIIISNIIIISSNIIIIESTGFHFKIFYLLQLHIFNCLEKWCSHISELV